MGKERNNDRAFESALMCEVWGASPAWERVESKLRSIGLYEGSDVILTPTGDLVNHAKELLKPHVLEESIVNYGPVDFESGVIIFRKRATNTHLINSDSKRLPLD